VSDGIPSIYFELRKAIRPIVRRHVPNVLELGEVVVQGQQDAIAWELGERSVSMGFVSTFEGPNIAQFVAITAPRVGRRSFHFNAEVEAIALLMVTCLTTDQSLPVRRKDVLGITAGFDHPSDKDEPTDRFRNWAEKVTTVLKLAICDDVNSDVQADRAEWRTRWNRAVAITTAVTMPLFLVGFRDEIEVHVDHGRGCRFRPEVAPTDAGVTIANDLAGFGSLY
jgi:hypothetical protein